MNGVVLTRRGFLEDRQGRTFPDVLNDARQPFDAVLAFFNDEARQRRMEESEIHHDRPPLAGVVRELESQRPLDGFFRSRPPQQTKRFRQAVGVVVRMIMEGRGWTRTGKKGSLGVRVPVERGAITPGPRHNTGGLAFWFLRAERYERLDGAGFPSVRERARRLAPPAVRPSPGTARRRKKAGSRRT